MWIGNRHTHKKKGPEGCFKQIKFCQSSEMSVSVSPCKQDCKMLSVPNSLRFGQPSLTRWSYRAIISYLVSHCVLIVIISK